MAYKEIEYNGPFLSDLLSRQEFYKYKIDPGEYDYRNPEIIDELQLDYLKTHSYQNFIKNFINPNTPYTRLLVKHGTGVGKTLTAIITALEFVKLYKQHYSTLLLKYPAGKKPYVQIDKNTPSVFVIGFSGTKAAFIRDLIKYPSLGIISLEEKEQLTKFKQVAELKMEDDIKNLNSYYQFLKKKITNKRYGGFFKFYGYRELVNRLFISTDINIQNIETSYLSNANDTPIKTLEDAITEYIAAGKIVINKTLLDQFENSIIICDESHNLYNSVMKNNYGVAIQYILNAVKNIRALFLTATPINNSPSEVIDLANLLTGRNLRKKDYFLGHTISDDKIKTLGTLLFGRVSFLEEQNTKFYPQRIIEGEQLMDLPFLKFIPAEMSEFQQKTYNMRDLEPEDGDEQSDTKISINAYALFDIAFPNPKSATHGLYKSNEIKKEISAADSKWQTANKIAISDKQITGQFLTFKNLGKYSAKFKKMIEDVIAINGRGDEKIFIYHDRVMTSGVVLIQEILKENGFIDEFSDPFSTTRCSICGRILGQHTLSGGRGHKFIAARFILIHSGILKRNIDASIERFNAPENKYGQTYKILLGSRIIKESFELKNVRNLLITSLPTNIPSLIQIFGRCIRKNSHADLKPPERQVKIRIYVHMSNRAMMGGEMSAELRRYGEKLGDYVIIQKIERELNRNAIDAEINKNIITADEKNNLPFAIHAPKINDITFLAYGFNHEEIHYVQYMIKRLFIWRRVWKYDDLFDALKKPPFAVEFNASMISEQIFVITLNNLLYDTSDIKIFKTNIDNMSHRLFDYADSYIYIGDHKYKIQQVGVFYILFPTANGRPIKDINGFISPIAPQEDLKIDMGEQFTQFESKNIFNIRRDKLLAAGGISTDIYSFLSQYDDDFYFELTKEAITYFMAEQLNADFKKNKYESLYEEIILFLDKFYIIIFADELVKYKDIIQKYNNPNIIDIDKKTLKIGKDTPIGFVARNFIFLYNNRNWIEVHKNILNRGQIYTENPTIVGFFEHDDRGKIKFKLREPITNKPAANITDARLYVRGNTCDTKNKEDLDRIIKKLKIETPEKRKIRAKSLCDIILRFLIDREIKERQHDSKIKYFYLIHEIMPKPGT